MVLAFTLCLLVLQAPQVAAANHGPGIDTADPEVGSYKMDSPGDFPVEVECGDDPEGDDIYVDFIANGRVIETDEDLWGFSPSFTFSLTTSGSYTLQARCRDTAGAMGTPNPATWRVEVAQSQAPPASDAPLGFDKVDPEPGTYALDGADSFDVEVECKSNDGVTVEFLSNGKVVETDTDFWGVSPSYSFLIVQGGTYTLGARCRSDTGVLASAQWIVTVPTASTKADILRQARVCAELQDPASVPDAAGEPGRVQDLLLARPDAWHRSGPWTCELAKLAGPVAFAYDLDSNLVAIKAKLEDWSAFGTSVWDVVADLEPGVVPAWEFFEGLLPILQVCSTALDGIEAFQNVRMASLSFLVDPSDAHAEALKGIVEQALPAYGKWIEAFDLTAAKVDELTAFLVQLADAFLAAAQRVLEDDGILSGAIADGLQALADLATDWAADVHGWADAIRALADPVRADVQVMQAILHPPAGSSGTPGPEASWLVLGLAGLAAALRRRR